MKHLGRLKQKNYYLPLQIKNIMMNNNGLNLYENETNFNDTVKYII